MAPIRACVRSLLVVLEVLATPTILLSPPALAELVPLVATGRSLKDRLLPTAAVTANTATRWAALTAGNWTTLAGRFDRLSMGRLLPMCPG